VQPSVRKIINDLAGNVSAVARSANPILMGEVGTICTRKILTTGEVPVESKAVLPPVLTQGGSSKYPILGFANGTHCDSRDRLSDEQIKEWQQKTQKEIEEPASGKGKWKEQKDARNRYLLRLFRDPDFCLPTTCGYQFVFNGTCEEELDVCAFFKMDGLGTAMSINHGVMQHFMGAMFSHQTCLPLVRSKKDDKVSASNCDNNFLIVGWGSNGGAAEVSESKRKRKKKTSGGKKKIQKKAQSRKKRKKN
jgi:hypothetical protein